jgi:hypothetical protein
MAAVIEHGSPLVDRSGSRTWGASVWTSQRSSATERHSTILTRAAPAPSNHDA